MDGARSRHLALWLLALLAVGAAPTFAQTGQPTVTEEEANAAIQRALANPPGAFAEWKLGCGKSYATQRAEARAFAIWQARVQAAAVVNADPNRTFYASINCVSDRPIPTPMPPPSRDGIAQGLAPAAEEEAGNATATAAAAAAATADDVPTAMATAAAAPVATATALGIVPTATGPIINGQQKGLGFKRPTNGLFTSRLRSAGFIDGTSCPTDLDWRQLGTVGGVKDQGSCGSCWAFAATGAMESAYAIATGSLLDLSDAQVVDCTSGGISDGCNGGWPSEAFNSVIKGGGIQTTATYGAYTAAKGACRFNAANAAVTLSGFTDLAAGDENALLQAVCNQPVTIALEANAAFMGYTGGIFSQTASQCGGSINHAVLLVGYGTDATSGQPFWIIRNSWGAGWGEGGYMRMARGANTCGLVTFNPSFPTVAGAPEPPPNPQPQPPEPQPPSPDPSCPPTYTIVSGDTLFAIAGRYQINYLTLLAANPSITTPDLIFAGQTLSLPCPPKPICKATVTVQSGDSLWAIGNRNGVGLQDMLAANPHFVDPNVIYPGDVVFVPPCTQSQATVQAAAVKTGKASCRAATYVAKTGDFPSRVAAMFNMQLGDLFRLNPTLRRLATRKIVAGQSLSVLSCPKAVRPAFTAPRACKAMYTIVAGDTAKAVASKAVTTVTKIMVANPWVTSPTALLPANRKLCITS